MKTVVYNVRRGSRVPVGYEAVYVGRGSIFGNPFTPRGVLSAVVGTVQVETRDEAIDCYEKWLRGEVVVHSWAPPPTREQIKALKGKALGCYCSPNPCHGDVLARLADAS